MVRLLFCALVFVMFGCTHYESPSVVMANRKNLAGPGLPVGVLPDGRSVVRYCIDMGSANDHWIYVVDDTATVSQNHEAPHGKSSYNAVQVVIDGVIWGITVIGIILPVSRSGLLGDSVLRLMSVVRSSTRDRRRLIGLTRILSSATNMSEDSTS